MNVDGTFPTRLTNIPGGVLDPVWSPDGTKIAFVTNRHGNAEIEMMTSDGATIVRLTTNNALDGSPVWSADSSKIAFVSGRDGNDEIYVMDYFGQVQTRVTANSAWDDAPAWSPDGTRLAFRSLRSGFGNWEIYTTNSDGTGLVEKLTNAIGVDAVSYTHLTLPTNREV